MTFRFSEKEQALILKLINYFRREKDAGKPLLPLTAVYDRVADALDVSLRTVQRIGSSGIRTDEDYEATMHSRNVSAGPNLLHEVHQHTIRARIYAMFSAGEHVTIKSLHKQLTEIDGIEISASSLAVALGKLKFQWRKCSISHRSYLMEQSAIVQKRIKFLREYMHNKNNQFSFKPIFLDETWIFSKGAFRKSWQDGSLQTVRKKSGEGVRYIILHAGSEDGFVENASLVFKSGNNSGDYHDSMNSRNFEKWFAEQLLPNLEEPSLIIMDNASYHCGLIEKIPNGSWSKQALVLWLDEKQIQHPEHAMKDQLWEIVKKHLPVKRHRVDELALKHGHCVLRLPPYHCQYNAIEMVWSECKRHYDAKITSVHPVTGAAVLNVWNEALAQVTSEKWKHYVQHTEKTIGEAWEKEKCIDASNILPVIIDFNDSDSDDGDEFFVTENEY